MGLRTSLDRGGDGLLERVSPIKLRDVGFRDLGLFGVGGEDRRPILRAGVGTRSIELRRIVSDGTACSSGAQKLGQPVRLSFGRHGFCLEGSPLFV